MSCAGVTESLENAAKYYAGAAAQGVAGAQEAVERLREAGVVVQATKPDSGAE